MKPKTKIVCPVCGRVVALTTTGFIPRHRRSNSMAVPVCFASAKTVADAAACQAQLQTAEGKP